MRFFHVVRSVGILSITVLLLSVDSGVFAAPTKIQEQSQLTYARKQSIIDKLGDSLVCDFCKAVVKAAQTLFQEGLSEDFIAYIATGLCKTFKIDDDYMCTNMIKEFKVCGRFFNPVFM